MANYMTQAMSSGILTKITYYRKQTEKHPSHKESGKFTNDAKAAYAKENNINIGDVELGKYDKCQGVPTSGKVQKI